MTDEGRRSGAKAEQNSAANMGNEIAPRERRFDLEDRTLAYAVAVRSFLKLLPRDPWMTPEVTQLLRSSGSVGANYIEANESLSKKDLALRIKICRKEAKESSYWLKLIDIGADRDLGRRRESSIQESRELTNIFGAILRKTER